LLITRQPVPSRSQSSTPRPSPPGFCAEQTPCGVEHPFGQGGSAGLALAPQLLGSRAGEAEKPLANVSTASQQLNQLISVVLVLNPNHSTTPAARKKTDFVPAETRTSCLPSATAPGPSYLVPTPKGRLSRLACLAGLTALGGTRGSLLAVRPVGRLKSARRC